MKSGILYDDYKNHFGQDSQDILVWTASSTLMNPTLTNSKLESQHRLDPVRYQREYEAEFAEDLETFLPSAWVESAMVPGRYELAPLESARYVAAVDITGLGTGRNPDAFTLSIGHYEKDVFVQDVCKGWRKQRQSSMDLGGIVAEIATILKRYRVIEIHGDKYAGQWPIEAFRKAGINYKQLESSKSEYYLALEPVFATGKIELLDHPDLIRELRMLERRPHPGGRITVDHPTNRHDDHANSLAISCAKAKKAIAMRGYPTGPTVRNPFSLSTFGPRTSGVEPTVSSGYPCPIGVGNSGWSLGDHDDDDFYVGAKPVR